jgi:hypothetical protein
MRLQGNALASGPRTEISVRRGLVIASCAAAAAVALYSCSMHATVVTDASGRVVQLPAIRIESSLRLLAVAMLVAGGHVAFELRWLPDWSDIAGAVGAGARP